MRKPLMGACPMFFQTPGLLRLLNLNIQASVGTKTMLKIKVEEMPMTKVMPTERIGAIGTMNGAMRTEKPTMVVIAERKTATPVERVISITQDL